jgi:hypothetical protein
MTSPAEKHRALFGALVTSYASQAMVCLGKLANPATGEVERDLEHASVLIDMLQMLEAKTEGNRTDDETSMLRQSLSMLRLNYVDEVQRPAPATAGPSGSDPEGSSAGAGGPGSSEG